jgi:hypothetical protein
MSNKLQAKVKAVNRANQAATELYAKLAPIFAPLVGKKIINKEGRLLAKVWKLMPDIFQNWSVYHPASDYSLVFVVKTMESLPDGLCIYHETSVYVGELREGVLTKLCDAPNLQATYTEREIIAKRLKYEEAKKAMDEAQNDLYPFGEYDH